MWRKYPIEPLILGYFKYYNFFGENFAAFFPNVGLGSRLGDPGHPFAGGHQFLYVPGFELYD